MRPIRLGVGLAVAFAMACGGASDPTSTPTTNGDGTTGGSTTGGNTTGGTTGTGTTTPDTSTSNTIGVVSGSEFSPSLTRVALGTTVTWSWDGNYDPYGYGSSHSVTFDDGARGQDPATSANFSRTFNTAGVYTYKCTVHADMTGTVIVQ